MDKEDLNIIVNENVQHVAEALAKFNISIYDDKGNYKNTFDVLSELATAWVEQEEGE